MIEIRNHRAYVDGRQCRFVPTEHVGGRIEPSLIVWHDTASRLATDGVVSYLKNNPSKVSAHFVIGLDGELVQMADCDRKTNHAGESAWRGRRYCNGFGIGVEVLSPGKLVGRGAEAVSWFGQKFPLGMLTHHDGPQHGGPGWWLPYDRRQLETAEALNGALVRAYPSIIGVAGHFEVSPGRKVDPGPHFPLERMRSILSSREAPPVADLKRVQQRLTELGYHLGAVDGHTGPRTEAAVFSFQRQNELAATGELDRETVERLMGASAKPFPTGNREAAMEAGATIDGSETLAGSAVVKRGSEGTGTFELVQGITSPLADGQTLVAKVTAARSFGEAASSLVSWAMSAPGLRTIVVLGLCAAVWYGAHRVQWARIRDFALGRNVGG